MEAEIVNVTDAVMGNLCVIGVLFAPVTTYENCVALMKEFTSALFKFKVMDVNPV